MTWDDSFAADDSKTPLHLRGVLDAAHERAESALNIGHPDARWELLRTRLNEYLATDRERTIRRLELGELLDAVDIGRWHHGTVKTWEAVVTGRMSVDDYIHECRLAVAAGISGGPIRTRKGKR